MSLRISRRLRVAVCTGAAIALLPLAAAQAGPDAPREQPGPARPKANPAGSPANASAFPAPGAASVQGPVYMVSPPSLEVREGSGDFAHWQGNATMSGVQQHQLRWQPSHPLAAGMRWSAEATPLGAPYTPRQAPAGHEVSGVPPAGGFGFFAVVPFGAVSGRASLGTPPGATRYAIRVIQLDADGEELGAPSNPAVIDYTPPGNQTQVLELDSVTLLDWSPKSGLLNGPNDNDDANYGADERVDLSFEISLVSESEGRLSPYLVDAQGKALAGSFYEFIDVVAGTATKSGFTTVRCDAASGNPHYQQTATGIGWKLRRKGSDAVLNQGSKALAAPLVVQCPGNDQLILTGASAHGAEILGIQSAADANAPHRAIDLHYSYKLGSQAQAQIRQLPLQANYQPVPNAYWTATEVNNGTGNATNRISLWCQSPLQPDVEVKYLRTSLAEVGSAEAILQQVQPFDATFTCKLKRAQPMTSRSIQQGTAAKRVAPQQGARSPVAEPALRSQDTSEPAPAAEASRQPLRRMSPALR